LSGFGEVVEEGVVFRVEGDVFAEMGDVVEAKDGTKGWASLGFGYIVDIADSCGDEVD
jgi:hypothetical protein